jgi:pyridoxine/pyridoxamine 5'-phosphate oxidase
MSLTTGGADGRLTLRTVLLNAFDKQGFALYTNLENHKARQLSENAEE